jgi:hypothetical protein
MVSFVQIINATDFTADREPELITSGGEVRSDLAVAYHEKGGDRRRGRILVGSDRLQRRRSVIEAIVLRQDCGLDQRIGG